jgi:hypothetical protein
MFGLRNADLAPTIFFSYADVSGSGRNISYSSDHIPSPTRGSSEIGRFQCQSMGFPMLKFKGDTFASLTCSGHTSWIAPVERVELYGDHSCVVIEEPWKFAHSPGLDSESIT